ncbi:unnamed protein product [Ambrosiozyma monospora]|uniref:Unnamed protein product n=1 Tax=Ambrosiozyma monospora TaxID=43982 RepID=A0ACB5T380_AMBMO|nr:unnamed protein product [Ambrosiozyma monospora]
MNSELGREDSRFKIGTSHIGQRTLQLPFLILARTIKLKSIELSPCSFQMSLLIDPNKHKQNLQFLDSCCANVAIVTSIRLLSPSFAGLAWLTITRFASSLIWVNVPFESFDFFSACLFTELDRLKMLIFCIFQETDITILKAILQALSERRIKNNNMSMTLTYDFSGRPEKLQDHFTDLIQLNNIVNGDIGFDGKLNLNTVTCFILRWKSSSRLLIDDYQKLLLTGKAISVSIDFSESTDENDLKIIETLNQLSFLRALINQGSWASGTSFPIYSFTV